MSSLMLPAGRHTPVRIDLGKNIRAGAHYTQFFVADFDSDGKAEMTCKTADGTVIYNTAVAYPIGIVFAALLLALFIRATKKRGAKKSA